MSYICHASASWASMLYIKSTPYCRCKPKQRLLLAMGSTHLRTLSMNMAGPQFAELLFERIVIVPFLEKSKWVKVYS